MIILKKKLVCLPDAEVFFQVCNGSNTVTTW